jgi:hypothetical protein
MTSKGVSSYVWWSSEGSTLWTKINRKRQNSRRRISKITLRVISTNYSDHKLHLLPSWLCNQWIRWMGLPVSRKLGHPQITSGKKEIAQKHRRYGTESGRWSIYALLWYLCSLSFSNWESIPPQLWAPWGRFNAVRWLGSIKNSSPRCSHTAFKTTPPISLSLQPFLSLETFMPWPWPTAIVLRT